MVKVAKEQMALIKDLFQGIEDSMVIACLQGYMGDAWVDRLPDPAIGLIVSGEYSFFGGDAGHPEAKGLARGLFNYVPGDETTAIYADDNLAWEEVLLAIPELRPERLERYRVAKAHEFDKDLLQSFVAAFPAGYEMVPFNEDLYHQAVAEAWSAEFCEIFADAADYLANGFGFAAVKDGRLIAGASTMTVYDGGTEVQVATREEYRQKGLALPCAAAFLLECSRRGIHPCWDAATPISRHMALKLGYESAGVYGSVLVHRP